MSLGIYSFIVPSRSLFPSFTFCFWKLPPPTFGLSVFLALSFENRWLHGLRKCERWQRSRLMFKIHLPPGLGYAVFSSLVASAFSLDLLYFMPLSGLRFEITEDHPTQRKMFPVNRNWFAVLRRCPFAVIFLAFVVLCENDQAEKSYYLITCFIVAVIVSVLFPRFILISIYYSMYIDSFSSCLSTIITICIRIYFASSSSPSSLLLLLLSCFTSLFKYVQQDCKRQSLSTQIEGRRSFPFLLSPLFHSPFRSASPTSTNSVLSVSFRFSLILPLLLNFNDALCVILHTHTLSLFLYTGTRSSAFQLLFCPF